jgi:hypothetical protein
VRSRVCALAGVFLMILSGCGGTDANDGAPVAFNMMGRFDVPLEGDPAGRHVGALVVSKDHYQDVFKRWNPSENDTAPSLPDGKQALFVAGGSGITAIDVTEVESNGDTLYVSATLKGLGDNCIKPAVVMHYIAVLAIDTSAPATVELDAGREITQC